jgi:hypothetical protein
VAGPGPHSNFAAVVGRWSLALDIAHRDLAVRYLMRVNSFYPLDFRLLFAYTHKMTRPSGFAFTGQPRRLSLGES